MAKIDEVVANPSDEINMPEVPEVPEAHAGVYAGEETSGINCACIDPREAVRRSATISPAYYNSEEVSPR